EQWPPCWGKSHTASQSPYAHVGQSCPSSRHQSRPRRTPGRPPVKWRQSAALPALVVASVSSSSVCSCAAPPHIPVSLSWTADASSAGTPSMFPTPPLASVKTEEKFMFLIYELFLGLSRGEETFDF